MPTSLLSKRMGKFSCSPTSALQVRIAELKRQGKRIISLNVGEPDFDTPNYAKMGGIKAIVDGFTKYTPGNGILELREAISAKMRTENGIDCDASNVCIATGAKQAVFSSLMVLCDEGDEVLIPVPCWVSYTEMTKLSGATPVLVNCTKEFDLDLDAIKAAITPRTRAIIICTPNNPTGRVYSESVLRELAALAVEHDFFIITDEIYEKLIYDGNTHFSVASISKEVFDRTVTINGFSKAYAMTGWRLGYAVARKDIAKAIMSLQSQVTSSACSISQKAALAAITGPQYDRDVMVEEFRKRKNYVYERVNSIPGMSCPEPQGAFYVLCDVNAYLGKGYGEWRINNALDLCEYFLATQLISVVAGEAYNMPGKIRISYSVSMEDLKTAFDRMEAALALLA